MKRAKWAIAFVCVVAVTALIVKMVVARQREAEGRAVLSGMLSRSGLFLDAKRVINFEIGERDASYQFRSVAFEAANAPPKPYWSPIQPSDPIYDSTREYIESFADVHFVEGDVVSFSQWSHGGFEFTLHGLNKGGKYVFVFHRTD